MYAQFHANSKSVEKCAILLLFMCIVGSKYYKRFESTIKKGELLCYTGRSSSAAQKLFRIVYLLAKNTGGDFIRSEFRFSDQIFRINAQLIFYSQNANKFNDQRAILYHLLSVIHYVMYINVAEYVVKQLSSESPEIDLEVFNDTRKNN